MVVFSVSLLVCGLAQAAGKPVNHLPPTEEEISMIKAALPTKASAQPAKPRKVLLFYLTEGFYHKCIPIGNKAVELLGEKTGAYETVTCNDMAIFSKEKLAQFDAIIFNNTTRLKFENPEQRKALIDFAKSGKGIMGIHSASDNFYDWAEAAEMIGGQFDGHPWTSGGTWAIKINEPGHILNRAFGGKGFMISDEIYQLKEPYSRDKLRVLVSLDMDNKANYEGVKSEPKREDKDNAISWIHRFGEGRVFYCSFGHNNHIFWNKMILRHYLDGFQYALGDLDADDTVSAKLREQPVPALSQGGDEYSSIIDYDFGQSRQQLSKIEEQIRTANPKERKEIEARLLLALDCPATKPAGKQFVCRMLRRIGTEESVSVLAALLYDKENSHMARFALQHIPSSKADDALREALDSLAGELKIGVISTIGQRGDEKAIPELAKLTACDTDSDESKAMPSAAISALGTIGGANAARALGDMEVCGCLAGAWSEAYLRCADDLSDSGKKAAAVDIYKKLSSDNNETMVRVAAYRGLVRADSRNAANTIIDMLENNNDVIRKAGGQLIGESSGRKSTDRAVTEAASEKLPKLGPEMQLIVLAALADRGDPAAEQAVAKLLDSGSESVQVAAAKALAVLGGKESIDALAKKATQGGAAGQAAFTSLSMLNGKGVDAALIEVLQTETGEIQAKITEALGLRMQKEALPLIMEIAGGENRSARKAAYKSLALMAGQDEFNNIIALLLANDSAGEKRELQKALGEVAKRLDDVEKAIHFVVDVMDRADNNGKMSLMNTAAQLGGDEALNAVSRYVNSKDADLGKAAIRALGAWSDSSPAETLLGIAEDDPDDVRQVLALRGCVNVATLADKGASGETVKILDRAIKAARRPDEKKLVLAALSAVPSQRALKVVEGYLDDDQVKVEAKGAYNQIKKSLNRK